MGTERMGVIKREMREDYKEGSGGECGK